MIGTATTPGWQSIVVAGVAAGSVDVIAAAAINHVGPGLILQVIASGLLGKASFTGGTPTMIAGLLLQWAMGMIIAAVFLIAATRLPLLVRQPLAAGMIYGIGVYLVMTDVVVPLSRAHSKPASIEHIAADLVAMMIFGVIVAMTPTAIAAIRQASAERSS